MGYTTYFTGSVDGPTELLEEFFDWLEGHDEFGKYGADPHGFVNSEFGDDMSWYDHEEDVAELSKQFPHILFFLKGEGEEAGDVWKLWARNGKTKKVQAELVFPEFDIESELPSPDVEAALEEIRAKKRTAIDQEIARLQREKAAI